MYDDTKINRAVGSLVAQGRADAGLSQQAVADYLGVKRPIISYTEAGERKLTIYEAARLVGLFGNAWGKKIVKIIYDFA